MADKPTSIYDFYRTTAGKNFFGFHFPAFIDQMTRIADALEKQNELTATSIKESKKMWLKEQYDKKNLDKNSAIINDAKTD